MDYFLQSFRRLGKDVGEEFYKEVVEYFESKGLINFGEDDVKGVTALYSSGLGALIDFQPEGPNKGVTVKIISSQERFLEGVLDEFIEEFKELRHCDEARIKEGCR